ncbi:ABC transporter substrate-binding protein [Planosporangium flavigriseum]|uniref:ABC transporter substrate-binding protein n=1 Tax=Planosporangium flavigriseum TaxID=373681 RepID=UPI00143B896C|nr:ABC transporter substrate-binding protein [Planosporangium flavigriseum]NJC62990.1 ABC transporter substrate-binding protein [Planosporangium flavigriseum]
MTTSATRPRRAIFCAAFLAVTAALASACASSTESNSGGSSDTASAGSSAGGGALNSKLPADLRGKDSIDVAIVTDYPPMSYMDKDRKIIGFHVDLLNAIAGALGTKFNYKDTSFASLIPELQSARVPMALGGTTDTDKNQAVVTLVDYAFQSSRLTVIPGNPANIQGLDTACGKRVGALAGSPVVQDLLDTASAECVKAGKPKIDWSAFKSADQSALALTSGRVDATLDSTFGQTYRVKEGQKIEIVGPKYLQLPIGIQVAKDNLELAKALHAALQSLIDSGEYKKILEKWGIADAAIPAATINAGKIKP